MKENNQIKPNDTVLEIKNLVTEFPTKKGSLRAVDDVSYSLKAGKTLCVVGESGSGKSVTARSILQILDEPGRIVSGQILLHTERGHSDGPIDLVRLKSRSRAIRSIRGREIAMIFQEPMSSLSPVHRIGNQIAEVLQLHEGMSKKAAWAESVSLLRQVGIPDPEVAVKRFSFEFSGGMRQRAMIAMALACNPSILIADEPTTALDVTTQAEVLDLIRSIQKERNMAVLFITHDIGIVAQIADEVVVMRKGKVLEQGDVYSIFYKPSHPYTRELISSARELDQPAVQRLAAREKRKVGEPILTAENVRKEFVISKGFFGLSPKKIAVGLKDASIELHAGENLGIVGESGSGKTTLARCLQRIYELTSGQVNYTDRNGETVDLGSLKTNKLRPYWRDIRTVFQDPFGSLNPRMTVAEIIGEPMLVSGELSGRALRIRVEELLEQVGLPASAAQRYPHAFSGGQRQRVAIARAIGPNPRIIIADEPTSALDLSLRSKTLDLLLNLQEQMDLSFIFVTHDISVVRYFCDRVAVMYKGEIVEVGDSELICTKPKHLYTQSLLSAVPRPDPFQRNNTRIRYIE
ncbi:ABC transporter ATP-binding protein [Arcticibacterium luteifluviistationis]|uniref:ABC transporter ATP-binding protein n=1 Tax=Arcticibacterium luteifluviistationis TaxID=1784714 RepID=A0A2Z4G7S4_9BACT|nr:ABC transporter ATP-binding protein [Arcticibacterium luteifluviistationis]AWV97118.1 ABC transporter ATP-binding protein [Arcticibacterium luteifluviistationis]